MDTDFLSCGLRMTSHQLGSRGNQRFNRPLRGLSEGGATNPRARARGYFQTPRAGLCSGDSSPHDLGATSHGTQLLVKLATGLEGRGWWQNGRRHATLGQHNRRGRTGTP